MGLRIGIYHSRPSTFPGSWYRFFNAAPYRWNNLTQWRNSPCEPRPTVPISVYVTLGPEVVTGSSRFQLKTPLGFFGAEMANSFQSNREVKRDYAN
ncbi:hypothetical protein TNCV_1675951 [Trichonephila clavipes]|nr:hypothetical protein TNCV_1675951 [Trichonephila clavipes]